MMDTVWKPGEVFGRTSIRTIPVSADYWSGRPEDIRRRGKMVGARGFEPPTPDTPCQCATRLRYAPIFKIQIWEFRDETTRNS